MPVTAPAIAVLAALALATDGGGAASTTSETRAASEPEGLLPGGLALSLALPLGVTAIPASSGVGARHLPQAGVRLGLAPARPVAGGLALHWGLDVDLLGTLVNEGTRTVQATLGQGSVVGRGRLGWSVGGPRAALVPYGLVDAGLALGVERLRVGDTVALRPQALARADVGLGLALELRRWLVCSLETTVGLYGLRPSTSLVVTVGLLR